MSILRKYCATLVGVCLYATAGSPYAQTDPFAKFRTALPALRQLLGNREATADLAAGISSTIDRRSELGGTPQAHVLASLAGPLSPALRDELATAGLEIIDRFDTGVWIARAGRKVADLIERGDAVQSAELIPPQAKVSDHISLDGPFDWQRSEGSEELSYSILFHKGVSAEDAITSLTSVADVEVDGVDLQGFAYVRSLTVVLSARELTEVAALATHTYLSRTCGGLFRRI